MKTAIKEIKVGLDFGSRIQPVGRLAIRNDIIYFEYDNDFLQTELEISPIKLPLQRGVVELPRDPFEGLAGVFNDSLPDGWGRLLFDRMLRSEGILPSEVTPLDRLAHVGLHGLGALVYEPDKSPNFDDEIIDLDVLASQTKEVLEGDSDEVIAELLALNGSSAGARPKALIEHNDLKYIAKFSASNDTYSVVKVEYIAMRLAALCGLTVAPVKLVQASGKDVILIERFDRIKVESGWTRKSMISALTLFGLSEMTARYASYEELAQIIRVRFKEPKKDLKELFKRLVFNILCGNNDDHARNHAAFWDGKDLTLTPAYDICPQARTGNETTQAMKIIGNNGYSQLKTCLMAAHHFLLSEKEAIEIFDIFQNIIRDNWDNICDEAQLTKVDKSLFLGRQFLNPFSLEY